MGPGLHAKQLLIKAGFVQPVALVRATIPLSYFPVLLSGSLTRLSNLSSFAISTSGPFLTSWPFFACEESKQGRGVSREICGDEVGVWHREGYWSAVSQLSSLARCSSTVGGTCLSFCFKPKVP